MNKKITILKGIIMNFPVGYADSGFVQCFHHIFTPYHTSDTQVDNSSGMLSSDMTNDRGRKAECGKIEFGIFSLSLY